MFSDRIDIFIECGETLRFSEVAKRRYTTQPTISRQIAALEEDWGVKLFARSNKGLLLTPEGVIMLRCCQQMRAQMDAALEQARSMTTGRRDKLRVGLLETLDTERVLLPMVEKLVQVFSGLSISITQASFGKLREGLSDDSLDIIFTFSFEQANIKDDVVVRELSVLHPVIVLSDRHPLYGSSGLSVADFRDEIFFLPEAEDSPGREEDLRALLRANGVRNGRIRLLPNVESVLFQVRLGKGLALFDNATIDLNDARYQTVPMSDHEGHLSLIAVWKRENLNPAIALLLEQPFSL